MGKPKNDEKAAHSIALAKAIEALKHADGGGSGAALVQAYSLVSIAWSLLARELRHARDDEESWHD